MSTPFTPSRRLRLLIVSAMALGLAACGLSGPPPTLYVLGQPQSVATAAPLGGDRPVIEIKPVRVSDYLDTTDLVVRGPDRIIPSQQGRWAERLSVGVQRALAASLGARLPGLILTTQPPIDRPARQLLVDVSGFEAIEGGSVILTARWTIADGASRQSVVSNGAQVTVPLTTAGDAGVVQAMSKAVDELAGHIAPGLSNAR
ncbi:PqiC family protein [Rhodospirillum rubrum]|uniref:ABC-type transport auxiliary lipoprotein component domain-containing protein n=1 Tax=Rhodospirillum rubrum (strain ATCC 11170 / ATH 1.1.1 / DSM 467 / LMG 4362 / NCIMB 8255 / S1) TaxID=269796 RepID=Q2RRJ7_RHORT|nr:PqiC family protein [Rhodospirillum rubrum]ABC23248.1 Protein of unknown function DUF330 [Rhodospirillum rubrum ATCC 11170]AEO48980.1 hypothetical protein F11_12580 [Rhodospirillum rubrum F11]MBK5954888.1 hypothetical protein [Rhodospirillum rubrum]QXG79223.1 PqiC family protein [Rhodospirillum rubrum]HAP99608.1 hypothetical protein [Rhodospirillum rubrum]